MSVTLLFFAVLAAGAGWWLSQQRLTSKPWLEEGPIGDLPGAGASPLPPMKVGLWVFLAVAGCLFTLLISAYSMQLAMPDMGRWERLPLPKLLWLNTGALALSSAALHWAHVSARRGRMDGVRIGLLAACVCALAFLQGQLVVWQQLRADGHFLAADPASAFFYLISGAHGLHVLGGLVAMGRAAAKMRQDVKLDQLRLSVDLCAAYWNFLLVVWLIYFTLLLLA